MVCTIWSSALWYKYAYYTVFLPSIENTMYSAIKHLFLQYSACIHIQIKLMAQK